MSEIWNKLLKAGVLKDPQSILEGIDSLMPSPGTFPCACCNPLNTQHSGDGDCDAKCQISTASPTDEMEKVSKIINSWTWEKDVGKNIIEIISYSNIHVSVNYCSLFSGMDKIFELRKNLDFQIKNICVQANQSCCSVTSLQKRLILFEYHIDGFADEKKAMTTSFNKEDLDKSNVKRKWLLKYKNSYTWYKMNNGFFK